MSGRLEPVTPGHYKHCQCADCRAARAAAPPVGPREQWQGDCLCWHVCPPPSPVREAGLRAELVNAMEAHEDQRRGGEYPHLGQTNDIRRFVDWCVDWIEQFAPAALLAEPVPLDVERHCRTCHQREEVDGHGVCCCAAAARLTDPKGATDGE